MVKTVLDRNGKILLAIAAVLVILSLVYMYGYGHDPLAPFEGPKLDPPSGEFWLGTDHLGRDVASRLIYGSYLTLGLVVVAVLMAMTAGTLLGMLAGYQVVPWLTPIIVFIGQISVVFPVRVLPLLIITIFGNGLLGMVLSMAFSIWGQFFWLIHDETKALHGRGFIRAGFMLGSSKWGIIRLHILPHLLPTVILLSTICFRSAIGVISTLSFLGIGVRPPTPTWGSMIADGHPYIMQAWWTILFPTAALAGSILLVNYLGNTLERMWNRKGTLAEERRDNGEISSSAAS
ncbi:ABC transporter permease [Paenibacillus thalictri]|uniref:ABC transporter permease n=1 Tax=Paenibacillus thalictri TaxID=2527873 RepID=A0A4Q9DGC9_9BACL|nr:ABC transporter permease [Paenibacillus thalictri]TBL68206.1 ABC transporter permease [Paenibacillus thalictri]